MICDEKSHCSKVEDENVSQPLQCFLHKRICLARLKTAAIFWGRKPFHTNKNVCPVIYCVDIHYDLKNNEPLIGFAVQEEKWGKRELFQIKVKTEPARHSTD